MIRRTHSNVASEEWSFSSRGDALLWWSDWGNRVVAGLGVYVLVYLLWLILGWGSDNLYAFVAELGFVPILMFGVIFAIRAIRHLPDDRQSQTAWGLIGAGLAGLFIADGIWAWYTLGSSAEPFPSSADVFYILSVLCLIVGVTRFPTPSITMPQYLRYLFDGAIILLGGMVIIGYFIIGVGLLDSANLGLQSALLFAYPFTDLMLVIAVLFMMLRRPRPGKVGMLLLLAAGIIALFAGNLWWVYFESRGGFEFHVPTYALWMIGYALIATSPQRQVDIIRRQLPLTYPGERAGRVEMLLPYIAAATALFVFILAATPQLLAEFGLLVVVFVVLAVFVAGRLILTLRENTQYQIEQVRQASETRIQALVEHSSDLITVLDKDFRIRFQSPSSRELTGAVPETFVGTSIFDWVHEDDRPRVVDAIQGMVMNENAQSRFEWRLAGPNGEIAELETVASNELSTPEVRGIVLNSRDMSERKQHERELDFRANHDSLTGLPNRAAFVSLLEYHLNSVGTRGNLGVMFIDLDRFKAVNDTLGHDAGDDLLIQVAERMQASVRSQDIISRFAGDEFTVLLPDIDSTDGLMAIAERIRRTIDQPFVVMGKEVLVSSSIGVTTTSISDRKAESLIHDADVAMYMAKHNGRDQTMLFEPEMLAEQVPADDD